MCAKKAKTKMSMICVTKVYAKKFDRVRVLFYCKTWSGTWKISQAHREYVKSISYKKYFTCSELQAKSSITAWKGRFSSKWEAFTCKTMTMVLKVSGKFFFYLSLICVIVKFLIGKMGSTQGFYASPVPKLNRKCHNLSRNFQQKKTKHYQAASNH